MTQKKKTTKKKAAKKKITQKEVLFMVLTWVVLLWSINFICGLIVQNRYIAIDPISEKTAKTSYGYFKPNQDKIILFPGLDSYKVKINQLGLRTVGGDLDMDYEAVQSRNKRILTVGDSFTFGLFVDDEDTYPYRLQRKIENESKDAIVLNAGVGGGTITDYLYYLNEKGLALKPDIVALNFCTNDLDEMMGREVPMHQKMIDENVFDLGKTIKLAKFMRVFRKMELAYRYKRWMKKTKDPEVREILTNNSKDIDGILKVAVYHAGTAVEDPYHELLQPRWEKYFQVLDEIVALLKENNIRFIYVIYPDVATVFDYPKANYQEILIKRLKEREIEYIDLRPAFKEQKDKVLEIYNDLPRDFHLGGYGNQILADEMYSRIKRSI